MPQIIPIRDLKNTTEISNLCHATQEPVFVTKNGYGDLVIMSIDAYEKNMFMQNVYVRLDEAEGDIREGKTKDARQSLKDLRAKHGI
jgi:PHD/YefM family antitoxin component YafN of YafNO toxin-antitoxin module